MLLVRVLELDVCGLLQTFINVAFTQQWLSFLLYFYHIYLFLDSTYSKAHGGIQQTKLKRARGRERKTTHQINLLRGRTKITITFITILMKNPDKHVELNIPTHTLTDILSKHISSWHSLLEITNWYTSPCRGGYLLLTYTHKLF